MLAKVSSFCAGQIFAIHVDCTQVWGGIAKSRSDHVPGYKDPMKIQSKGVKSSLTIAASSSISFS